MTRLPYGIAFSIGVLATIVGVWAALGPAWVLVIAGLWLAAIGVVGMVASVGGGQ